MSGFPCFALWGQLLGQLVRRRITMNHHESPWITIDGLQPSIGEIHDYIMFSSCYIHPIYTYMQIYIYIWYTHIYIYDTYIYIYISMIPGNWKWTAGTPPHVWWHVWGLICPSHGMAKSGPWIYDMAIEQMGAWWQPIVMIMHGIPLLGTSRNLNLIAGHVMQHESKYHLRLQYIKIIVRPNHFESRPFSLNHQPEILAYLRIFERLLLRTNSHSIWLSDFGSRVNIATYHV